MADATPSVVDIDLDVTGIGLASLGITVVPEPGTSNHEGDRCFRTALEGHPIALPDSAPHEFLVQVHFASDTP